MTDAAHVDPIIIGADDPLLAAFAMQHDLRERFVHALEQVRELLSDPRDPADPAFSAEGLLDEIDKIVHDALDDEQIIEWMEADRPLPWLDERLGEAPQRIQREVLRMVGVEVRA